MKRVLTELTPECEVTAQMFISGMEKEEIAEAKCRAFSTINNQLQKAFQILNVKNGRQLCKKFYERLSGVEYTFDFLNPEKPDVPLNKNDAFQKVQKRRVQKKW